MDRMKAIVVGTIVALCFASSTGAQPIVLDGVGRMTAVQSLPFDWTLTLGWPNTTVLAGERSTFCTGMYCYDALSGETLGCVRLRQWAQEGIMERRR